MLSKLFNFERAPTKKPGSAVLEQRRAQEMLYSPRELFCRKWNMKNYFQILAQNLFS